MKRILIFLLIIEAVLLIAGLYFEITDNQQRADKFLGSFTLILFLVIIPVFLYWRLKDKDLSPYYLKKDETEQEN